MILDGEVYRKPKPVTLDGGEHRKSTTEYRNPSGRTDNLRSRQSKGIKTARLDRSTGNPNP